MKLASLLDSKRKRTLITKFRRWKAPLGLFVYIVGLLGFLALPHEDISPTNYVDENALMPGYATNSFSLEEASEAILLSQRLKNATSLQSLLGTIEGNLLKIGLEVHHQHFSARLPLTGGGVQGRGVNMYATLRAQRASGMEALVVHVPLTDHSTLEPAFALVLAKFFARQVVWAKDLIFLFTTEGALGPQAWLEGYIGVQSSELTHTQLPSRSGSIQGAVTLEHINSAAKKLDVSVVGQNGLLPNQDIFNALAAVSRRANAHLTFDGQSDSSTERYSPRDKYFASLRAVLCMVAQQATGLQGGLHGVFVRYHIDALTIRVPRVMMESRGHVEQTGKVVESLIRSLNNLLETLHHSLYSYLTVSSDRYLSFTFFLPPLALMWVGPALDSFEQWFVGSDPSLIQHGGGWPQDVSFAPFPVRFVCIVFSWAIAVGAVMHTVPLLLHYAGLLTPDTLAGSLLASWVISAAVPTMYRGSVGESEWRLLKFLAMLILIALLFGLSVLNFSLSLVVTAFVSLPSLFARPKPPRGSSLLHTLRLVALLLCSPVVAPLLATVVYHLYYTTSLSASDPLPLLNASVQSLVSGLSEVYTAHWVFHQWLFPVACFAFAPLWTILWVLSLQRLHEQCKEHLE